MSYFGPTYLMRDLTLLLLVFYHSSSSQLCWRERSARDFWDTACEAVQLQHVAVLRFKP